MIAFIKPRTKPMKIKVYRKVTHVQTRDIHVFEPAVSCDETKHIGRKCSICHAHILWMDRVAKVKFEERGVINEGVCHVRCLE